MKELENLKKQLSKVRYSNLSYWTRRRKMEEIEKDIKEIEDERNKKM